jgi:hypothetical protein
MHYIICLNEAPRLSFLEVIPLRTKDISYPRNLVSQIDSITSFNKYRVFQNELCNFESLLKFIQMASAGFLTAIM